MSEMIMFRRVVCASCNRHWRGEEPYDLKKGPGNCLVCGKPMKYSPWFGSMVVNGRPKELSSGSNDKKAAEELLEKKFQKFHLVPEKKARRLLVPDAVDEFIEYCEGQAAKGLTPNYSTTKFYRKTLRFHFTREFKMHKVVDMTHEQISTHLNSRIGAMRDSTGKYRKNHGNKQISPNTIKDERAAIRAFFTWCVGKKYIVENPASKIKLNISKKEQDRNTKELFALTREQVSALLIEAQRTIIRKSDGKVLPVYTPNLLHFLRLGFNTGMRSTALKTLMWEEVLWEKGRIEKYSKGDVLLKIPITPTVKKILYDAAALEAGAPVIACPKTGLVMKSAKTGRAVRVDSRYGLQRACKNAGIKEHVTDHIFRHTFATLAIAQATNMEELKQIADILGHADPSLLLKIYTHANQARKAQIMEAMAIDI